MLFPRPRRVATWITLFAATWLLRCAAAATVSTVDSSALVEPAIPSWVDTPVPLPTAAPQTPSATVRLLVVEQQVRVADASQFVHYAMRVETEAGLQSAGQISVVYASTYQQLHWHFLRIWRDGRPREVLTGDSIQVLRQEEDAERFTYHGFLSAVVILHDLRVGDVVEYAYTRTGANPVFDGRFSLVLPAAATVPVDVLSYRVIEPAGRTLHVGEQGKTALQYSTQTTAAGTEHRWRGTELTAVHPVSDAPASEVQIPFIEMSEFSSWSEVAAWGTRLFTATGEDASAIREMLASLTQPGDTLEQKANRILRFVQDDVRYLAVQFGESSHRPAPPAEVLRRRFGDCKDKSLLLVAFLRALGLPADVALVHSDWHDAIEHRLPSPLAFDHVIVRVVPPGMTPARPSRVVFGGSLNDAIKISAPDVFHIGSKVNEPLPVDSTITIADLVPALPQELWIDATTPLQGGAFGARNRSDFGFALLLKQDAAALTPVPPMPPNASRVEVHQLYHAEDFEKPARLDITARYYGGTADVYRYLHRSSDPAQNMRQFTGFLARFYPKIRAIGLQNWRDDRDANVITIESHFEIPELWTVEPGGKNRTLEVAPWALSDRLPRPETIERSVAFALPHPQDVTDAIELRLPKAWPWRPERRQIDDETFQFDYRTDEHDAEVEATYHWRTKTNAVPAASIAPWMRKMADVRAALGVTLRQNIRLAAAVKQAGVVWPLLLSTVGGLAAGALLGWRLRSRRRPDPAAPPPLSGARLTGISGWLILVAIAVTLRPFALLMELRPNFRFIGNLPAWIARTDAESVNYAAGFASLIVAESFFGTLLAAWSAVLLVQFYRRKSSLPLSLATFLIFEAAWLVVHSVWYSHSSLSTPADESTVMRAAVQATLGAAVWCPYLFISRRVKRTFVN